MALTIADYVVETAANPGTGTISLGGAATGRVSFVSAVGSGNTTYYYVTDGTKAEWGIGTVTAGTPNTLSRDTVIGNTSGNTNKLSFTGTVTVYCEVPADKRALLDVARTWLAKQTYSAGIAADTITEKTAGAGVTADSVLLKDGRAYASGSYAYLGEILNTASPSNAAVSALSIPTGYRRVWLVGHDIIPATDGAGLRLQVSSGGYQGASYLGGGATSYIPLLSSVGSAAGEAAAFRVELGNPDGASVRKMVLGQAVGIKADGTLELAAVGGCWNGGNGAIDGLRILFSSGNIASGSLALYGERW